jgi:hydrogen cyanide synthase HcnB
MAGILDKIDYRPDTLVWSAEGSQLDLLRQGEMSTLALQPPHRCHRRDGPCAAFPGLDFAGHLHLGAAQVALKFQGCAIGSRVVFAGTGPLLYLIAYQYAKAGAKVAAVLDTASFADKAAAAPAMLGQPALLPKACITWAGCACMALPCTRALS